MAEKKDLLSRLKDLELKELESNEIVQKILENEKSRCLVYDLAGTPVRVVSAFPREVRYYYEEQRTRPKDTPIQLSQVESENYDIMSKLCLDAPFNTAAFWDYYDTETGKFWGVFARIYEEIEKSEEKIGDFRKK